MGANGQGANATHGRWLTIPRTLTFITNGDDVLLMKRGPHMRVFPNLYNGLGGHIERDEDPLTSARREVLEESGLEVRDLHLRAVYNVDANQETGIVLFVFVGSTDQREVVANQEGSLHWIPVGKIGDYALVEDLAILLPRVLLMRAGDPPLFYHVTYDAQDALQMRLAE